MKIAIGYPPTITKRKGATPLLSQNRQYQEFSNPTFIFPVVLASAATILKSKGFDVLWKDSIAENISEGEFFEFLRAEKPEIFAFETKTPVIKKHWNTINKIKENFPEIRVVLMGDHVTSFPQESLKNSKIDFVLTGGDFDFLLLELCEALKDRKKIPKGVYYWKGKKIVGEKFVLKAKLDDAPFIDRELTKWRLYEKEYNLIGKPFFYIMSGRDCWWSRCSFCSWPRLYPRFRTRSVKNVLDEVGMLIEKYNAKEIFDDSGTITVGLWLKELCNGLIERGYNKKIVYSCNMRFGALKQEEYGLMKKAGFRLLKYGLESGNQETLDRLNKGIKIEDITEGCKMAKKAGLTVHITLMVGYNWETKEMALNTLKLAKYLMESGRADLLQSTIIIPYPGTPLWEEAMKNKWFLFDEKDYERFDMSEPVLKTKDMTPEEVKEICNSIYKTFLTPRYVFNRIKNIRSFNELMFNLRGVKAVFGHLRDFGKKK